MRNSQSRFYALDMSDPAMKIKSSEDFSLVQPELETALTDGSLFFVGSTYCPDDGRFRDSVALDGPKVITFAHLTKYRMFPLGEILSEALAVGRDAFGSPVEIEFAVKLERDEAWKGSFNFLQIRPMVAGREQFDVVSEAKPAGTLVCASGKALGNGRFEGLTDIVYGIWSLGDLGSLVGHSGGMGPGIAGQDLRGGQPGQFPRGPVPGQPFFSQHGVHASGLFRSGTAG